MFTINSEDKGKEVLKMMNANATNLTTGNFDEKLFNQLNNLSTEDLGNGNFLDDYSYYSINQDNGHHYLGYFTEYRVVLLDLNTLIVYCADNIQEAPFESWYKLDPKVLDHLNISLGELVTSINEYDYDDIIIHLTDKDFEDSFK